MNAFLFPGQGSQEVGMGKDLYETLPAARELLDQAAEILGYDLKDLMFNGPADKLTDTRYAQSAIYVCSAMHLEKAKAEGITYAYAAGHSLGEYSALYAAGAFDFAAGLRLVDRRGRAMAAQNGKGTMAAVLGLTEEELRPYTEARPDVVMANLNAKRQIVISGTEEAVAAVSEKLEADGASVRRLRVSAAFHSPQMSGAAEIMTPLIEGLALHPPRAFVVCNVTGKPTMDMVELKANLIAQITGQVRWYESVMNLAGVGVERFYECGHGKVLRSMNKAITLRPKCFSI